MGAKLTVTVALPANLTVSDGVILTFVVPAPSGCNLKCPFCFIQLRKEPTERGDLAPLDFRRFIDEVAEREVISAICIQGYEPLLPDSFPYTSEILARGRQLGVPTSIVTNGTHLAEHALNLARLQPSKISVSLDASTCEAHDRQRGKQGAFAATLEGLRVAADIRDLSDVLCVASVLIPKKREQLIGMPALLKRLGIRSWVINALLKVGKDDLSGPVGNRAQILQDLLLLQSEAERHDVELTVDDEFDRLGQSEDTNDVVDINYLRVHRLLRPSGVFRLLPNGQCSIGLEFLREMRNDAPKWIPGESHASDFLRDSLLASQVGGHQQIIG